jgi:hypothetical protein
MQIFFNKQNKIKYGRVRHIVHKGEQDYNPNIKYNFNYCKIEDLSQVETLVHSINFQFPQAKQNCVGQDLTKNNADLMANPQVIGHKNLSLNQVLEPRAGFDPATITLPR